MYIQENVIKHDGQQSSIKRQKIDPAKSSLTRGILMEML